MKVRGIEIDEGIIELFFERLIDSDVYEDNGYNGPKEYIEDIAYGDKIIQNYYKELYKQMKMDKNWYKKKYHEERQRANNMEDEINNMEDELDDYQDRCLEAEALITLLGSRINER